MPEGVHALAWAQPEVQALRDPAIALNQMLTSTFYPHRLGPVTGPWTLTSLSPPGPGS